MSLGEKHESTVMLQYTIYVSALVEHKEKILLLIFKFTITMEEKIVPNLPFLKTSSFALEVFLCHPHHIIP